MNNYTLWDSYMRSYDFLMGVQAYQQGLNDILDITKPKLRERILDAGSGTGNLSLLLKAQGAQVTSLDFAESALDIHRQKDPEADLLQASLEEPLPIETSTLGKICCASVMFTLTECGRRNAVFEFYRILKPGGQLILTMGTKQAGLLKLFHMHYSGLRSRMSRIGSISRILLDFPKLSQIAYYNFKLQGLPRNRGFSILNETELEQLLSEFGFVDIAFKRTYGSSFLLVNATKPFPVRINAH